MIKKFTVIFLLTLFVIGTFSSFAGEKIDKGIKAGWQYSNLYKDGESLFDDPYNGFYVGFFSNKKFLKTKLLQLNSALTYYQIGAKSSDSLKLKLHYLNLPVSLKVKLGPLYVFGGLNGALKLGGEKNILGEKYDVKDFTTFDAGAFVGIGAKIAIIGIEVKYDWGLVDVNNGYKTQYLQAGLTVSF